jgi:hypothetical protein
MTAWRFSSAWIRLTRMVDSIVRGDMAVNHNLFSQMDVKHNLFSRSAPGCALP